MEKDFVLALVAAEMSRTEENNDNPNKLDYIADLVRHLNNLLPDHERFFPGDW